MSKTKNRGLGRGLEALFAETRETYENAIGIPADMDIQEKNVEPKATKKESKAEVKVENAKNFDVEIDKVYANPNQPRKHFDAIALDELANSIEKHGIIAPILVSKTDDGYMIIAGERRYRAAKQLGLKKVPIVIGAYTDRQIQEISLIENLQREDLNPIEVARGIKQLMEGYDLTQDEVSKRLGKSRSSIANTLRLLTLSDDVIELIADGKLTSGHARALITLPPEAQYKIAVEAIRNGYSVRDVERLANEFYNTKEQLEKQKEQKKQQLSLELRALIEDMRHAFKTKVTLVGTDKKGMIRIDYYNKDDLNRLYEITALINKENKEKE